MIIWKALQICIDRMAFEKLELDLSRLKSAWFQ